MQNATSSDSEKYLSNNPYNNSGYTGEIIIGNAPILKIHQIDDRELNDLYEGGSQSSIELNFSIALLSCLLTIIVTLLTVTFENPKPVSYYFLVCLGFITFVLGLFFIIKWYHARKKSKNVREEIIKRLKLPPQ
jgi:heme/copper-type cytochrome/quinol oxidase subunit 4